MVYRTQTARLLKTVRGKPHATEDDHESSDGQSPEHLLTPPHSARDSRSTRKSERKAVTEVVEIKDEESQPAKDQNEDDEDIYRDPESSSDEADDMAGGKKGAAASSSGFMSNKPPVLTDGAAAESASGPGFQALGRSTVLEPVPYNVGKPGIKLPSVSSASITAEKRQWSDADLDGEAEDNGPFPSSYQSSSQSKKKRPNNMHAVPRPTPSIFGEQNKRKVQRAAERMKKQAEKEKQKQEFTRVSTNLNNPSVPAAVFKRHHLSALHGADTTTGAADDESHPDGSTSPLTPLSPSPEPDSMGIVCDTCHEKVNKLLKEEYQDDYVKGKSWNIQWQERFCEWHRTRTAKDAWKETGYPEIDWAGLERRMRKHDTFLLSVLRKEATSHYRQEYAAKVKAKSMSNGYKDAAVKPGATVGYYGPKGEKAMSEHILSGLSDEIRERAKTDRLVSPSGYQGGISGFVQGVLVPHLAELLIKDDMKLEGRGWEPQARQVISESAEIGELVHPDVEERNQEDDAKNDWMLQ